MKQILIKIIKLYQKIPGKFHYSCKYVPSCSEYFILALEKYGVVKGMYLGTKRILKCNPFSKGGFDPLK